MTLPEQIRRMDGERLRAYADNLAFYNGEQWPASMARSRNRRLVFNYAKAIVDKTASYLMTPHGGSTGVNLAVDPEDETPEAHERAIAAERALLSVYDQNNLDQLDFDTEIDAAVLGDGAYKVTWDAAERRVRVSAPDVQGLFAWWAGDDVSRVWRVASRYCIDAEAARALYGDGSQAPSPVRVRNGAQPLAAHAGEGARAPSTVEIVEVWTAVAFELWAGGARVESRENPYGFIPYVIFPNIREPKKFWGASDLPPIKEPVRELNRALTQLSMILELSGNPIAVLENVSESNDIAVVPWAVWELPERARAYLLDLLQGGGVKLHADYVDLVYRALHDLGESPRTAFGENRAGLSGIALNVELDPLLKKVARKRLIRGAAYRRRNEMILRILEQYAEPRVSHAPYRSRIAWGSVLPLDRSRMVEDERALVAAGIHSRRRAADNLGVGDPEAEFVRWLEERRLMGDGD
ncbi:MAG: phage portal protein [Chloroflexi bacterium]|nr:phage portal protein [Chloroflexota bacterium]